MMLPLIWNSNDWRIAVDELAVLKVAPVADSPFLRRAEFNDFRHAISDFSGDDSYGVRKWLSDFKNIMDTCEADSRTRLMF